MEEKKISEFKATAKEWGTATCKVFHQVDKELWVKGRIAVGFGIVIVSLLRAIADWRGGDHERFFDRDGRGSMMQDRNFDRNDQFGMMRRGIQSDSEQNDLGWMMQWCRQQATLAIDPQNPNIQVVRSNVDCPFANDMNDANNQKSDSFFGRMEARMQQFFGKDNKGAETPSDIAIPNSVVVVTWTISK